MNRNLEQAQIQSLSEIAEPPTHKRGYNVELEVSVPTVQFGPFRSRAQANEFRDLVLSMLMHSGKEVYVDIKREAGSI